MASWKSESEKVLSGCAQEIARSTAGIVGYDVIITDMKGIIIGASRAERLGCHHEASDEVIRTGHSSATSAEVAATMSGTLPGVTHPIASLNGTVVGTMAITGEPEAVQPFALIVRKQIEILLREQERFALTVNRESSLQDLVQEMVSFAKGDGDEEALAARAGSYGIDARWYYLPLSAELYQLGRIAAGATGMGREVAEQEIYRLKADVLVEIRAAFGDRRALCTGTVAGRFAVFWPLGSEPDEEAIEEAVNRGRQLVDRLGSHGHKIAIGFGNPARGIRAVAQSYRDAGRALAMGKKLRRGPGVYRINEFRIEELLSLVDRRNRSRFAAPITSPLRAQFDWEDLKNTVRVWCDSGFSLVDASKRLAVHRNTLLYRQEKIERLTGRKARDFRAMLELYLALVIDEYDGPAQKE